MPQNGQSSGSPRGFMHYLQTCAGLAIHVRDALARTSDDDWSRHWRGDPAMKRMNLVRSLEALANYFASIDMETRFLKSCLRLPRVRQWDAKQAKQVFFTDFMDDKLKVLCDRLDDPARSRMVGTLIAVAFKVPVKETTVRGRRRRKH